MFCSLKEIELQTCSCDSMAFFFIGMLADTFKHIEPKAAHVTLIIPYNGSIERVGQTRFARMRLNEFLAMQHGGMIFQWSGFG